MSIEIIGGNLERFLDDESIKNYQQYRKQINKHKDRNIVQEQTVYFIIIII